MNILINGKSVITDCSTLYELRDKYYKDIEDSLSSRFGTKVKISEGSKKGKIEIEYYTKDDLERILFELRQ